MKKSKKGLWDDKRLVFVASLLLAVIAWVVVAGFIAPGDTRFIRNVRIDYVSREAQYSEKNLLLVGTLPRQHADVEVSGDNSVTGGLNQSSVRVYADYSAVNGPGVYRVPLYAEKVTPGDYNIIDLTVRNGGSNIAGPRDTVEMTFQEKLYKTFTIQVRASQLEAAPGHTLGDILKTPTQVTVSGPKNEVERISSVVADVADVLDSDTQTVVLNDLTAYSVPLSFLDANGNRLDIRAMALDIDASAANVEVPVHYINTIALTATFANLPDNIDREWFNGRVSVQPESIQVSGPAEAFENLQPPFPVKIFDASSLGLNWVSESIPIVLPNNLINMNGTGEDGTGAPRTMAVVSFNTEGLAEKTFDIPIENIHVVNAPANTEVLPVNDVVTVRLLGDAAQLESLLPDNIFVEVSAAGISAGNSGLQSMAARVLVPSRNQVLPLGSYVITCNVEPS